MYAYTNGIARSVPTCSFFVYFTVLGHGRCVSVVHCVVAPGLIRLIYIVIRNNDGCGAVAVNIVGTVQTSQASLHGQGCL
jgi:hypothetical protein